MSVTAKSIQTTTPSEVRNVAVSFADKLDVGELLTGTPTITEITTSDLTFANKAVSTAALTIEGVSVPLGEAVQFKVSGGLVASSPYTIRVTAGTDSTPAQTLIVLIKLEVVAES